MAPLGYDTKDRKISVNEVEAERVRTIFRSYLRLGSLSRLMADLRQRGIVTKIRTLKSGPVEDFLTRCHTPSHPKEAAHE
jgi:site-specific DNA recombinase